MERSFVLCFSSNAPCSFLSHWRAPPFVESWLNNENYLIIFTTANNSPRLYYRPFRCLRIPTFSKEETKSTQNANMIFVECGRPSNKLLLIGYFTGL